MGPPPWCLECSHSCELRSPRVDVTINDWSVPIVSDTAIGQDKWPFLVNYSRPGFWSVAEPRLTPNSSINVQWLHLDIPIHSIQPLNLIIVKLFLSFLLMPAISGASWASWPGSGPCHFWWSSSVKVPPPCLVVFPSLTERSVRFCRRPRQKFSAQGEKGNRGRGRTEEGRPPRQPVFLEVWLNGGLGIHCGPLFHPLSILQNVGEVLAWRGSKLAFFAVRAPQASLKL